MAKRLKIDDRHALMEWEAFRKGLINAATVDDTETEYDKRKRVKALEQEPEKWFEYYFPNYYTSRPAKFHRDASKRLLSHPTWYEVRAWSRELAKSARSMMEVLYLTLTGQNRNILVVSNSQDNAIRLMDPLRINLESNPRMINDYGVQKKVGAWESAEFTTVGGVSFRALGAGQSPRGTRNEAARPDFILIDDLDTDEVCRNPERLKTLWKWVEEALIPTVSISGDKRILFNGNIIGKDCCIRRAMDKADHVDVINIRDKDGRSSWPEKNSEERIDQILSKLSTAAIQKEYFNNPISEGDIFTEMTWGLCPPLEKLQFVVVYADPSTSERKTKGSSFKAQFLMGYYAGKYYVYTGYLDQPTFDEFIDRFYDLRDYVGGKTAVYFYNENNSLQDPFWQNVILPKIYEKSKTKGLIAVTPDTRAKIDKYARIESNLEPINRTGNLVLNIEERGNPHMIRLEEQFLLVAPGLPAPADGPDCIEGGKWMIDIKLSTLTQDSIVIIKHKRNSKRI